MWCHAVILLHHEDESILERESECKRGVSGEGGRGRDSIREGERVDGCMCERVTG